MAKGKGRRYEYDRNKLARFIRDNAGKMSIVDMADEFEVSHHVVKRLAHLHKISLYSERKESRRQEIIAAIHEHKDKLSAFEISKTLRGVSTTHVMYYADKEKIPLRKYNKDPEPVIEDETMFSVEKKENWLI